MSDELRILFTAMIPFSDIKFAIPLGLNTLNMSTLNVFIFAGIGMLTPAVTLLAVADPLSKWLMKHSKIINKMLTKLFNKTRTAHSKNFNRYGALLIFAFIAIPIPGSGTISGGLIAFIFGVDYWKATFLMILGTAAAEIILILGTETITKLIFGA